jgi:spore germination cell wall hydrolase CwlJ-like protein
MEKNNLKTKLLKITLSIVIGLIGIAVVLIYDLDAHEYPEAKLSSPTEQSKCMAEAIYFEAGNQPFVGKMAVGNVIMNRVRSNKYPDTICNVVHQGPVRESWKKNGTYYPIRDKCQFSYWCDGRSDDPQKGSITWKESVSAAQESEFILDYLQGSTNYHAYYVSPTWAHNMQKVVEIEDHIFYK